MSSAETVIELTRNLVDLVNNRKYDHPFVQHMMAPSFRAKIEGFATSGLERHLDRHRALCEDFPEYRLDIKDAMADVDEQRGRAKVWVTTKMSHFQGEVERLSIYVFSWKRREGVWTCYQQKGLRGIQIFD